VQKLLGTIPAVPAPSPRGGGPRPDKTHSIYCNKLEARQFFILF
jgi:hypothetical protein